MCDQDLLVLLAEDFDRYFDRLVAIYQRRLFVYVFFQVRNRQDAEDVIQETFVHAYRSLASSSSCEIKQIKLTSWLFTIARNCAINHLTRGGKHSSQLVSIDCSEERKLLESTVYGQYASPEEEAEEKEAHHQLYGCVQQLQDRYRLPVLLHYILGLGYREVADILHQPFNTTKSNGRRGLKELQKMLQQEVN